MWIFVKDTKVDIATSHGCLPVQYTVKPTLYEKTTFNFLLDFITESKTNALHAVGQGVLIDVLMIDPNKNRVEQLYNRSA